MYYLFDGSFEGFLSALTLLMREKKNLSFYEKGVWGIHRDCLPRPLVYNINVENIPGITENFAKYLSSNFGKEMPGTVYNAFLSEQENIENYIARFIIFARKTKSDPSGELYIDYVKKVVFASKKTLREAHRYMGLIRFRKVESDIFPELFAAVFEPECNVLPIVSEHFAGRLASQPFLIIDSSRNICAVRVPGENIVFSHIPHEFRNKLCYETSFEQLWKMYYKSISIPERKNLDLQRNNMPLKYRKHLIEI